MVKRLAGLFVALFIGAAVFSTVQAQNKRVGKTSYLEIYGGVGGYYGEVITGTGEKIRTLPVWGGEVGYQLTPAIGIGVGGWQRRYPNAIPAGVDQRVWYNWQLLFKYLVLPESRLSPYLSVGGQLTTGDPGGTMGAGPVAQVGVDMVLSDHLSVFAEGQSNTVVPDEVVDNFNRTRRTAFDDVLHFVSGGLRYTLRAPFRGVQFLSVEMPDTVIVGREAVFSAAVDEEATRPVAYQWRLGDGTTAEALSVRHSYKAPGRYAANVVAENAGSQLKKQQVVEVMALPQVRAIDISPDTVRVGQTAAFSAETEGSGALSYWWQIGEEFTSTKKSPTVSFEEPGTYEATLKLANPVGADQQTASLVVAPAKSRFCSYPAKLQAVHFSFDRHNLDKEAKNRLDANVRIVNECPTAEVHVYGLTDRAGTSRYNDELSRKRAQTVKEYYLKRGISEERVTIVRGLGEASKVCWQDDLELGCRESRRVESKLVNESNAKD